MQLDADGEDQPFFKPQVLQTEPLIPRTGPSSGNANTDQHTSSQSEQHPAEVGEQDLQSSTTSTAEDSGVHDVAARVAAATINAEQTE